MSTSTPSGGDADRAPSIADIVNASLVLDEWLVWMLSLCGQCLGTEQPFFVRSQVPRLDLVPRLDPPPDEEGLDRVIAYGLYFFSGWHDPVRVAVSTWSHLLVASSGSAGAVRSSLISGVDLSTGKSMICFGFPPSVVDPSAHEAVLGWFTGFADHVRYLRLPALSDSNGDMFSDNRCWEAARLESFFADWSWNRDDAARLAAMMECERRTLFQAWKLQATAESLPSYQELWRRDRRLSPAVVGAIGKVSDSVMDRCILTSLWRLQPCKKDVLCGAVCGPDSPPSGAFNGSLKKLQELKLMLSGGRGKASQGYRLTDFGLEVADALQQMAPPSNVRSPS